MASQTQYVLEESLLPRDIIRMISEYVKHDPILITAKEIAIRILQLKDKYISENLIITIANIIVNHFGRDPGNFVISRLNYSVDRLYEHELEYGPARLIEFLDELHRLPIPNILGPSVDNTAIDIIEEIFRDAVRNYECGRDFRVIETKEEAYNKYYNDAFREIGDELANFLTNSLLRKYYDETKERGASNQRRNEELLDYIRKGEVLS